MIDEWLLSLLTGFIVGILIIKTSPIWIAGYRWVKNIIPSIKKRYQLWGIVRQGQKKAKWAMNSELCTNCGSGFGFYFMKENQPFPSNWAVGRECLNSENPHYWISRQGMKEVEAKDLLEQLREQYEEKENESH